jgi:nucleotide-binding universal stress UspA family protein
MFERILLPLDGSEFSEISIPYGEELAGKLGSEVILYHVPGHENSQQEHMHQMYLTRLAENMEHNIKMNQLKGTKVKVTTMVEAGLPTSNICNFVDKNRVDLIIMAAVSASGLNIGKMMGSVTDQVCQTVPIPVMLIRPQSIKQSDKKNQLINHVLIPLDGSELSKLALPIGEELATKLKVSTTLFQMATTISINKGEVGANVYADYLKLDEDEKNRVCSEMIALEKGLKKKGLDVTNVVTFGFDAAYEIIEICKKIGIDMVVMSTRGRSGFIGRWVFGSVAEKVLRYGETPLLLVHARAD